MKKFAAILPLMMLSSCQWIATHPKEDVLVLEAVENVAEKLYEYESHVLFPAPINQLPPFKIPGADGPSLK